MKIKASVGDLKAECLDVAQVCRVRGYSHCQCKKEKGSACFSLQWGSAWGGGGADGCGVELGALASKMQWSRIRGGVKKWCRHGRKASYQATRGWEGSKQARYTVDVKDTA